MKDTLSISRLKSLHPSIRQEAIEAYEEAVKLTPANVHPVIDETIRSFERSDRLYKQANDGKDNDGDGKIDEADEHVTNAKAGQSYHNYGYALDFHLKINGVDKWVVNNDWMTVIKCFEKRGFKSGLHFPFQDAPHLEKPPAHWSVLLAKYNSGDFIPGETYVNA